MIPVVYAKTDLPDASINYLEVLVVPCIHKPQSQELVTREENILQFDESSDGSEDNQQSHVHVCLVCLTY
jgi:hypothetical protein